ncbi:MAG: hypothetical protein ACI4EV_02105 [Lachnospiraceae bacterium]
MYAKKENKVYKVDGNKEAYLAKGYDIIDESGNVVEKSPVSTVPSNKYDEVLKENAALKSEIETLKAEIETLKASEPAEKKGKEK